ncbi:MAG: hypothetical protein PWP45_1371 [Tepidanaerobacteraceae bacterium]|nr:hypothetical protein [Tepidanaerobacteraceae bacterium]
MKIAILKTSISRKKLLKGDFTPDSEEIVGYEEVDEDEFYGPLVKIFYEKIKEASKESVPN